MDTTYRGMLRTYADGVRKGHFDSDLKPAERKVCALILSTVSNVPDAAVEYRTMTEADRERAIAQGMRRLWDGNASFFAGKPWDVAADRALIIMRGI